MAQEFHFGEFTLDLGSYRLQRGTRVLRVEKLPMELLILLVQRPGDLVSREEIAERLWGKDVFVDLDHGINTAIRKLRLALRDDPETPRFIETVVGKGYRFAATVVCNGDIPCVETPPLPSSTKGALESTAGPAKDRFVFPHRPAVLSGIAVLVLLAIVLVEHRRSSSRSAAQASIHSLAVLPLKNLSGDPGQEYFADGMTEELIGRLSSVRGLRVISRTSATRFKDTHQSVPQIAQALHVDAVVEGSVLREGSQVRVTVQLIRGATDESVWAGQYQREDRSILALQDEVARSIVERIKVSLTPGDSNQAPPRIVAPEAHEAYLKGRYYFNQRTEDALNKSISYFQQAIARDPGYALAHSGLADAYAMLGFRGGFPPKEALSHAKAEALKAIELDDTLAEPHVSLAFIAETYEWDWATAEREYKRALELNPGDVRAHNWYAGYLMYVGRFEEGIAEAKRARDLDPLSLPVNNALAGRLLVAGQIDEALAQLRETLEMDPHFAPAHQTLGWVYLHEGKQQDAIQEFQNALQLTGTEDTDLQLDLGFAYAVSGKRAEARRILGNLEKRYVQGVVPASSVGILHGALGEPNEAFAWLEKAYKERDPQLTYLKAGRRFEPLRKDPRLEGLVRRVGLPD